MATRELPQWKPSTLIAACFIANSDLARVADGKEAESAGDEHMEVGLCTPKCASCAMGFEALHGGDPKKNGGEDETAPHRSASKSTYSVTGKKI